MAKGYKMKTHKGTQKRTKKTGNKNKKTFMVDKSCNNHLLLKKKKGGNHKKSPYGKKLPTSHEHKMARLLPYA